MGIVIEGKEYSDSELSVLSKAGVLQIGQKNDPSSATPTASSVLQGQSFTNPAQYGLFSYPGVRPERFSALARPRTMASLLRPERSEYLNEIIEIVTGQTAGTTTNATGWCADGALAGVLKTCQQVYTFGNFKMRSRIVPIQEVGQLRNRADIPGMILNNPPQDNPLIPDLFYRLQDTQSQLQLEFFNLGVQIERSMEIELFQGVVGTDTSIPGFWKDFNSISSLVKTGYADVTGTPCPAADSVVVSWNADVAATVGGRNIVQAYTDTYYALRDRGEQVGMSGVQYAFVMRKEAFRALTEVWVCQYSTYRCQSGTAGNPVLTNAVEMNNMRLEMMNGQYLLIDGVPVPVIFSDGIPLERLGAGTPNVLSADAFLLPISWNGRRLIRFEYHDMGNPYATELANQVYPSAMFINNGMYMITKNERDGCIEFTVSAKFRMWLEVPFLAARIDDMSFSYSAPTRDPMPGTTFLYVNGGVTYRS